MTMKSSSPVRDRPKTGQQPGQDHGKSDDPRKKKAKSRRESVESFVVVFVSLLLWNLEAEGFVIPTGSMAPTLMGRHKEIVCRECGYVFTVNADRELDPRLGGGTAGQRIESGTCENCRYESPVGDEPSFTGDRIYVMKRGLTLPFLGLNRQVEPRRWDIVVFKLPEEPEIRYIKRLIGLPDEVVRIEAGDLWVRPAGRSTGFDRLRRSLDHQQAMQLMVYDDGHRPAALLNDRRWLRWAPMRAGDWTEPAPGRFLAGKRTEEWNELRYHHLVPSPAQWKTIESGQPVLEAPRATLVTDFSSYNTAVSADDRDDPRRSSGAWLQPHWVGDLTLSLRATVRERAGNLRLELVKAGISHRCEIDLSTGLARLFRGESPLGPPAPTPVSRPGSFDVVFANVDDRLTLWVDGAPSFGDGRTFDSSGEPSLAAVPTAADLEPVRIAVKDAAVEVDHLVLRRDIYYTISPSLTDFMNLDAACYTDSSALFDLLSDPTRFSLLVRHPPRDYAIAPGRYMMLGDNSPWSRDSRAWGRADQIEEGFPGQGWDDSGRERWEVPKALVVGKAFCVYWPHAKPVWPKLHLSPDFCLPILPYIERMRWIR
jgi:signal peptidase I